VTTAQRGPAQSALSKSQQAYDWVKDRIVGQSFSPGYRLVLGSIAAELDMSVVPVREAIRRLEAEGLVTFKRNVGAHVAMVNEDQYRNAMHTLGVLEGAATALAVAGMTAADIAEARDINEALKRQLDAFDPRGFTELNHRFHERLFQHCTNPRLLELVNVEWARLAHLRLSTFAFVPGRAQESVAEHDTLLTMIGEGAPIVDIEMTAREHRWTTLRAYLTHEHPHESIDLAAR
jgi:DNA-binding GntR family transcriptional regulator